MSCGHKRVGQGMGSAEVEKALRNPDVQSNVQRKFRLNRDYDLPYLAGYSKDASTIYVDRHLPERIKIGPRLVDVRSFLETHERVEKAIIDALGWKYPAAHEVATAAERRQVISAGLSWQAYSTALRPYIKADEVEKLKSVPQDLDLRPYEGETKLLARMKMAMHEKA